MAAKWEYHRFHDDSFMLVCRVNADPKDLDDHPSIQALEEALSGARKFMPNHDAYPRGAARDPRHWSGKFTLGTCEFRVPAIYAFRKFFGLVCDPVHDTHDADEWQNLVNLLNAGIPD